MKIIISNQHDLKFLIQKRASVVESTTNVLKITAEEVNVNFKRMVERINNIKEAVEEIFFFS